MEDKAMFEPSEGKLWEGALAEPACCGVPSAEQQGPRLGQGVWRWEQNKRCREGGMVQGSEV